MAQRQTTAQLRSSKVSARPKPKVVKARSAASKAARKKALSPVKRTEVLQPQNTSATTVPRPKGKLGQLLASIEGTDGATLEELSAALSWQPHSTRAAITGLRKRGFEIALTTEGDRKAYRIVT